MRIAPPVQVAGDDHHKCIQMQIAQGQVQANVKKITYTRGSHHLQLALVVSFVCANLSIYWCAQAHMEVHWNLHFVVVFVACGGGGI